jgi:hypothetical protein
MTDTTPSPLISHLRTAWPSPIVSRTDAARASGGLVARKTLANEDSRGTGPDGLALLGGRAVYPADSFFAWLESWATRPRPRGRGRRT